jgi:hypothetical protein
MRTFFFLLPILCLLAGSHAAAQTAASGTVYRCSADGKTGYADRPCERGPSVALPPPAAGVDASLGSVRTDDSRTLLELEKMRIERERRNERADRDDLRAARAAQARGKRCRRLGLRAQWAQEDAARAQPRHAARAEQRLRRARDTLAAECPA